jgi:phage recombination protein Bet
MLAVSYCAARHLDPFKRPVHIVPVYNSTLRREVETVWPGINELLTTAARSGAFGGVDEPQWGPDETRTFTGTDRDGATVSKKVVFREWCSVKVWRIVGGVRVGFSQPVYWIEAYGRQKFRSELPTDMWGKRPLGQLQKCALAASLRLAFPEDLGSDYAAEEMEGREVETGGVTIDHGDADLTDRDRQADRAYQPPKDDATATIDPLAENNGTQWLKNLAAVLAAAKSVSGVVAIGGHPRVVASLESPSTPPLIKDRITTLLREAHERLDPKQPPASDEQPDDEKWDTDPIAELIAEIETMDIDALDTLRVSKAWAAKTRNLIPPDHDTINEAIALRREVLKGGNPT